MRLFRYIFHLALTASLLTTTSCGGGENNSNGGDNDEPIITPSYTQGEIVNITVLDYMPAPGQFVNQVPEYTAGDTPETMCQKATELLNNGDMISLGAWGGYVTLKLNNPISNIAGKNDLRIVGNAVYANASTESVRYGSSEPGIVLVMQDTNGNGLADDTWYELKGSETGNGMDNYTVTYHQPAENATADNYIYWEASNGDCGYINNSGHHEQSFFPMWLNNETMTFHGRRLPDNGKFNTSTQKYDLMCYNGYADCHPNNTDLSCLDIDNAIDNNGKKVNLGHIDFIKIYTGVLQSNGPLGECSTEIAKIEQLKFE